MAALTVDPEAHRHVHLQEVPVEAQAAATTGHAVAGQGTTFALVPAIEHALPSAGRPSGPCLLAQFSRWG